MWLANLLTLARLPLAVVFWLVSESPAAALAVLVVSALTDVADGWVARRSRRRHGLPADTPSIGAWLDPLCDKTFVVSVLVATWWRADASLGLVLLIAARELVQAPLVLLYPLVRRHTGLRYDFRAGPLGKAATVLQFATIVTLLAHRPEATALAWVTGAIGLAAATDYVRRGVRLAARGPNGVPARPAQ